MCRVKPTFAQTHRPGQFKHYCNNAPCQDRQQKTLQEGGMKQPQERWKEMGGLARESANWVKWWINVSFPEQPPDNSPSDCPSQSGACVWTMYMDCCWWWIPCQDPANASKMTQVSAVLLAQAVLGRGGKILSLFVFFCVTASIAISCKNCTRAFLLDKLACCVHTLNCKISLSYKKTASFISVPLSKKHASLFVGRPFSCPLFGVSWKQYVALWGPIINLNLLSADRCAWCFTST